MWMVFENGLRLLIEMQDHLKVPAGEQPPHDQVPEEDELNKSVAADSVDGKQS